MSKASKGKKSHADGDERTETDPASTELAKEGKAAVTEIKKSIILEALRIIHETMPQKVCSVRPLKVCAFLWKRSYLNPIFLCEDT
jgi:hypothetical protein